MSRWNVATHRSGVLTYRVLRWCLPVLEALGRVPLLGRLLPRVAEHRAGRIPAADLLVSVLPTPQGPYHRVTTGCGTSLANCCGKWSCLFRPLPPCAKAAVPPSSLKVHAAPGTSRASFAAPRAIARTGSLPGGTAKADAHHPGSPTLWNTASRAGRAPPVERGCAVARDG